MHKKAIGLAVDRGGSIYIYDEHNSMIGSVSSGSGPDDGLVGYTSHTVSVRRGGSIYTYDASGSMIGSTSAPQRRPAANAAASAAPRTTGGGGGGGGGGINEKQVVFFIILAAAAILVVSPGVILMAWLRMQLGASWEPKQMWTFAAAVAAGIWVLLYIVTRDLRRTTIRYFVLCAAATAIFVFCHLGLQTQFTRDALRFYFP